MTTKPRWLALTLVGSMALGACRTKRETSRESTGATSASPGSLEGARRSDTTGDKMNMPGMTGMMGMAMMDSMQTHMRMMDTMSGDRMKAMLPMHRQMVANMLSRMNAEMRSMNMSGDAAWSATVDSVRQDLIHMPELSAQQLKTMMPGHRARVMRLLAMHQRMMNQSETKR